jgi:integrase
LRGHIRQVGDDRYQVLFDISPDPVTGKRRQRSRTVRGSRARAEAVLAELIAEVEAEGWIDDGSMTVGALAEMWLAARASRLEPTTLDGYRQKLAHVIRHIGHRKIKTVTGGVLSAMYGRLEDEGLSGQSALHVHRVTHKMLADATRWGYLRANPAAAAEPPVSRTAERQTWTAAQSQRLLAAVAGHRWRSAWWLALAGGLRRAEVCGLTWDHVDLEEGTILIRKTLVVVEGRDQWSTPKTPRSRRIVAIDAPLVPALREERLRQLELRMADPASWSRSEGTVICWEDGRRVHPDRLTKAHKREVVRIGLEPYIAFHDLRHTHATLALAAGTPANVVKERLGHASVQLTLDRYTHRVDELHREAAAAVGRMLTSSF